ncbi:MAG: hypothetical protein H6874_01620 [Hyphomicrobiaceae bacterium]|nr:hypothetical protein [Hyphomicrobiaceae bacterium]
MTKHLHRGAAAVAALCMTAPVQAATYGDLAQANGHAPQYTYPAGPYASTPGQVVCDGCVPITYGATARGMPPSMMEDPASNYGGIGWENAMPYLPISPQGGVPSGRLNTQSYVQTNAGTDPFNPWGLQTQFMFVPWSTPLSGWTNAQTWNWWRVRSGAFPPNW